MVMLKEKTQVTDLYKIFKLEIWGIFLPLLFTIVFSSITAGLSVVAFAVIMFVKNNKKVEALIVLKYAGTTVAVALLYLIGVASLAVLN